MIPFCRDETSTRATGTDFTLQLHREIRRDRFPNGICLQKPIDSR